MPGHPTAQARILPFIVAAQFACTSLWFAGNGVMEDLRFSLGLAETALGHLTSAVQLGFISGTLVFALFTISDRYSPSKVFFWSAMAGAIANLAMVWADGLGSLLFLRFLTGFCLAGVYPVGMKLAADHFNQKLGKALGYLVGALVVGTALPHLLRGLTTTLPWTYVIMATSSLAVAGGVLVLLGVPDGPHRTRSQGLDFTAFIRLFRQRKYRQPALGYFGHMWELYALWAFVPVMAQMYMQQHETAGISISLVSFWVIAIGGVGCVLGGYIAQQWGSRATAIRSLWVSMLCCLAFPLAIYLPSWAFVLFLLCWGFTVVPDSPQFSTLAARGVAGANTGTALTIMNSIGFAITVVSIQTFTILLEHNPNPAWFMLLAAGPALGLWAMGRKGNSPE